MRCILHIGTEKTATTTIQNWLYDNEANLTAKGIALTREAGYNNNYKLPSYFSRKLDDLVMMYGVRTEEERVRFYENFEQEFGDEIRSKAADHHTVMLSSEHFHSRLMKVEHIRDLKAFLDRFFDEYQVICYFREQSELRRSLYSTNVRAEHTGEIDEYARDVSPGYHYYDYTEMFGKWESVFGIENLHARIFERSRLKEQDIRKDFASVAMPDVPAEDFSFNTSPANEALSSDVAGLFTAVNAVRPATVGRFKDPLPAKVKEVLLESDVIDHDKPITDPDQLSLYEEFDETNRAFFKRYFGTDDNLFRRPKPVQRDGDESLFTTEEVGQILSDIISPSNVTYIREVEIDRLRDVAVRLRGTEHLSDVEALTLLKIANRARPYGSLINEEIEDLLKDEY